MPQREVSICHLSYIVFFIFGSILYVYEIFFINPELYDTTSIIPVMSIIFFILAIMCGSFEMVR